MLRAAAGGSGGASIGSTSDTQVLFNDGGAIAGDSSFIFNKTTKLLSAAGLILTAAAVNTAVLASTGYSLTGSNATSMIDLAGTWNTSGNPSGIKLNITNTTSGGSSRLINLQVGGVEMLAVNTSGDVLINRDFYFGSAYHAFMQASGLSLKSTGVLGWTSGDALQTNDLVLARDAAGILAQRNSTSAQTFRVYNTYTDGSNYERGVFDWTTTANTLTIGTQNAGTGALRSVTITGNGVKLSSASGYAELNGNGFLNDTQLNIGYPNSGNGNKWGGLYFLGPIGWAEAGTFTVDLFQTRRAAATFQFGAADAASPVAQTLATQGSRSGTDSNVGGGSLTIQPGIGTGTGTPSNLVLKGIVGTTTGTGAQAASTALTIAGVATGQLPSIVLGSAALATNATDGFLYIPTCAGAPSGTPTAATGRVALVYDTTNDKFWIYDGGWMQPKTPAGAAIVTWQ